MGVYIEARDVLSEDDWDDLRMEAVNEIMDKGLRVQGQALSDLIDAKAALETKRYVEALHLLDRALNAIKLSG